MRGTLGVVVHERTLGLILGVSWTFPALTTIGNDVLIHDFPRVRGELGLHELTTLATNVMFAALAPNSLLADLTVSVEAENRILLDSTMETAEVHINSIISKHCNVKIRAPACALRLDLEVQTLEGLHIDAATSVTSTGVPLQRITTDLTIVTGDPQNVWYTDIGCDRYVLPADRLQAFDVLRFVGGVFLFEDYLYSTVEAFEVGPRPRLMSQIEPLEVGTARYFLGFHDYGFTDEGMTIIDTPIVGVDTEVFIVNDILAKDAGVNNYMLPSYYSL